MLDAQTLFNAFVSIASLTGGAFLKMIWDAIKSLQTADAQMAADISSSSADMASRLNDLQVLVAGNYIQRSEYRDDLRDIKDSLKRIEDGLNSKQDK